MSIRTAAVACLVLGVLSAVDDVYASSIVLDPVGDTLFAGPYPDITSIDAMFTSEVITFVVTFADTILPPSPIIMPNSIAIRIDVDIDQNPATGFTPVTNRLTEFFGYPPVSLGDEFIISDGGSVNPQEARVLDSEFNHVAFSVPNAISYGPQSVSITIPLMLLGDDGLVNYAAFVFGGVAIPGDRAPNGTVPATSAPVPEPTTLLLLTAGLAMLGRSWRKTVRSRR